MSECFRFLFIGSNNYELELLNNLSLALMKEGVDFVDVKLTEELQELDENLNDYININQINIVFAINLFRDNFSKFMKDVRWISWVQDSNLNTRDITPERLNHGDIVYLLAHPKILNIVISPECRQQYLYTGVSEQTLETFDLNEIDQSYKYDVSIVGYLGIRYESIEIRIKRILEKDTWFLRGINIFKLLFILMSAIKSKVLNKLIFKIFFSNQLLYDRLIKFTPRPEAVLLSNLYGPLFYSLYNLFLGEVANNIYRDRMFSMIPNSKLAKIPEIKDYIDELSFNYPRAIERESLVKKCNKLDLKLAVFGNGWEDYPEFHSRWHGYLVGERALNEVFKYSKINLHCNPNGFGLHSRVLQSMGAGGFIMTHKSLLEGLEGTITSEFKENIHFCFYSEKSFDFNIIKCIKNSELRRSCRKNAHELIATKHMWSNRAQQILLDLQIE